MGSSGGHSPHDSPPASVADVEVSELTLDEEEFSSTFGTSASLFAELDLAGTPDDPWGALRRND